MNLTKRTFTNIFTNTYVDPVCFSWLHVSENPLLVTRYYSYHTNYLVFLLYTYSSAKIFDKVFYCLWQKNCLVSKLGGDLIFQFCFCLANLYAYIYITVGLSDDLGLQNELAKLTIEYNILINWFLRKSTYLFLPWLFVISGCVI